MLLNLENLGEKTLNKIAEMALASRFAQVDSLTVQIKTDPNLLSQGMLESLAIDGQGLRMNPSLRLQELRIDLQTIAVNPLKALRGNIQLTKPSTGTVRVVFHEEDLERAYRSSVLKDRQIEGVSCRVGSRDGILVQLRTRSLTDGTREMIDLQVTPQANPTGFVDIGGLESLPSDLAQALARKTQEIFQLQHFEMDGFTLSIESIELGEGQVTLRGRAGITRFPSK
jgi:hypothetical protein